MKAGLFVLMLSCCLSGEAGATEFFPYNNAENGRSGFMTLISSQSPNPAMNPGNLLLPPNYSQNYQSQNSMPPIRKDTTPYTMQQRMRAEQEKPVATQGWAYAAPAGQSAAVYFSLQGGLETDVLKSVSTPWAQKAMIHQTSIDEQGVARMSIVDNLDVASESNIEFSPQGLHVMLTGLKRELRPFQFFPVLLNFEKAGMVRFMVFVRTLDSRQPAPAMQMDMTTAPASTVDVMRGQPSSHMHPDVSARQAPDSSAVEAGQTHSASPPSDANTAPH